MIMLWIKEDKTVSLDPKDTVTDIPLCPFRDWLQSECWICDYCGRNEAGEHGAEFPITKIGDWEFFEDDLKSTGENTWDYGLKKVKKVKDDLILTNWRSENE